MPQPLRQRAEYTHRHNLKSGRHGWLRLTPAYSLRIVEEIIESCEGGERVLDPFSGTATTALSAAYRRHPFVTIDVNPFLVWLGRVKTAGYLAAELRATMAVAAEVVELLRRGRGVLPVHPPPIHNIGRWWPGSALDFLCSLKGAVDAASQPGSAARSLLYVSFCRTLIALSNAAFNHQSMSFRGAEQRPLPLEIDMPAAFLRDVNFVLTGAAENPEAAGEVIAGDSRYLDVKKIGRFDRVISSPPYVNRMSYIRELRPYMYWLGYLNSGRDAGELDWGAIGGTWGIATSRLADWAPPDQSDLSPRLKRSLRQIAAPANPSGRLLANYVAKYFCDMRSHFGSLSHVLNPGAEIHYIVGNSVFYGVLLPTQELYAEMLAELGFRNVTCTPIRKRNSKRELIEFDVRAAAPHR